MLTNESFFETSGLAFSELIVKDEYVWESLNKLKEFIAAKSASSLAIAQLAGSAPLERTIIIHEGNVIEGDTCTIVPENITRGKMKVYQDELLLEGASVLMSGCSIAGDKVIIGKGVFVESGAMIKSPSIIGDHNEIRQGAYVRGDVLTGRGCVIGHATEVKHSIFLNDAKAGHFNYIGDSILGNDSNLGAGTKLANLRFFKGNIVIRHDGEHFDTGRRKLGAILGDNTQTGCNSVTNPGALLGRNSFLLPNTTAKSGYHGPGSLLR